LTAIGLVEKEADILLGQPLDPEQMAVRKKDHE
jgi:hypothetical protein